MIRMFWRENRRTIADVDWYFSSRGDAVPVVVCEVLQPIMLKLCYDPVLCSQLAIDYCIDCSRDADDSSLCEQLLFKNWLQTHIEPHLNSWKWSSHLKASRPTPPVECVIQLSKLRHQQCKTNVFVCQLQ